MRTTTAALAALAVAATASGVSAGRQLHEKDTKTAVSTLVEVEKDKSETRPLAPAVAGQESDSYEYNEDYYTYDKENKVWLNKNYYEYSEELGEWVYNRNYNEDYYEYDEETKVWTWIGETYESETPVPEMEILPMPEPRPLPRPMPVKPAKPTKDTHDKADGGYVERMPKKSDKSTKTKKGKGDESASTEEVPMVEIAIEEMMPEPFPVRPLPDVYPTETPTKDTHDKADGGYVKKDDEGGRDGASPPLEEMTIEITVEDMPEIMPVDMPVDMPERSPAVESDVSVGKPCRGKECVVFADPIFEMVGKEEMLKPCCKALTPQCMKCEEKNAAIRDKMSKDTAKDAAADTGRPEKTEKGNKSREESIVSGKPCKGKKCNAFPVAETLAEINEGGKPCKGKKCDKGKDALLDTLSKKDKKMALSLLKGGSLPKKLSKKEKKFISTLPTGLLPTPSKKLSKKDKKKAEKIKKKAKKVKKKASKMATKVDGGMSDAASVVKEMLGDVFDTIKKKNMGDIEALFETIKSNGGLPERLTKKQKKTLKLLPKGAFDDLAVDAPAVDATDDMPLPETALPEKVGGGMQAPEELSPGQVQDETVKEVFFSPDNVDTWDDAIFDEEAEVAVEIVEDALPEVVATDKATGDGVCQEKYALTGKCRAAMQRWSYDPRDGTCNQFIYGGCGANGNNFASEKECVETCQ